MAVKRYPGPWRRLFASAVLGAIAAGFGMVCIVGLPAAAQPLAERLETCSACHGVEGRPEDPTIPILGGQPRLYALYQLFFFREGRRKDERMSPTVEGVSDDDMQAMADYVATLPPPNAPATPVDDASYERGKRLARNHLCDTCHGADYAGREHVARLAWQQEDYLMKTLLAYKAGTRIGIQAAMAEVLSPLDENDLADLSHFLAHFRAGE